MKRILLTLMLGAVLFPAFAQNTLRVEAPAVVGLDEQFNVTFIIEGDSKPTSFSWEAGSDFKLVWGPQEGSSTSIQIINGKRSKSSQYTYTYILTPYSAGKFELPKASATVGGKSLSSNAAKIEVVSNGASSSRSSQGSDESSSSSSATGDIPSEDLFMRLTLSRTNVVVGEPVTASLKLYQRVNIAGFEDAKFPTFNGFWSQETVSPTNIEFNRESFNDKIYDAALIRSYVLIPQKSGELVIDPSELVCLVNLRTQRRSSSIFDDFFDSGYRTVRKRISTPAVTVHVKALPSGAPASFGGGVGSFSISARLSKNQLKTNDAASLIVTVSGKGNVSLLEAPKLSLHPDMELYDVKSTDNSDKSTGGTSGSKVFEFPFIPRSYGEFSIDPIEYSYYDVNSGKYVTLVTDAIPYSVEKGSETQTSSPSGSGLQVMDKKGVKNLGEDIRYISLKQPDLGKNISFFVASALFWILAFVLILAAVAAWLVLRKLAVMKSDLVAAKTRKATKMALGRLKQAQDFLKKNLQAAFYEELHKALLGYVSDKLNLSAEQQNKETISGILLERGVPQENVTAFTDLLDACEFERYAPQGGNAAMEKHYHGAVDVISSIDSSMKTLKGHNKALTLIVLPFLAVPTLSEAAEAYTDSLWNKGVQAYSDGQWEDAANSWEALLSAGCENETLFYNAGNAAFKAGDYPRAILYYEKALKANPSNDDARYNLEFAQTQIQDRIDAVPEFVFKTWLRKLCYVCSSNAWSVLALSFLLLFLAMTLLFLLSSSTGRKRMGFYSALVLLLFCFFSLSFARWQYLDYIKSDYAIVMKPVSSVKSSPSSGVAKDLFVLHGGVKLRILDRVGEWMNISLADGRQGWIKATDLEVI